MVCLLKFNIYLRKNIKENLHQVFQKKEEEETPSYSHFEASTTLKSIIREEKYRPEITYKHIYIFLSIGKWNEIT